MSMQEFANDREKLARKPRSKPTMAKFSAALARLEAASAASIEADRAYEESDEGIASEGEPMGPMESRVHATWEALQDAHEAMLALLRRAGRTALIVDGRAVEVVERGNVPYTEAVNGTFPEDWDPVIVIRPAAELTRPL